LISQPISPTAYWALVTRPDRGRPTLHGWWAPVALRYIKRWGAAAQRTRFAVSRKPHRQTLNRSREGAQPATGSSTDPRRRHCYARPHCIDVRATSTPPVAARVLPPSPNPRWLAQPRHHLEAQVRHLLLPLDSFLGLHRCCSLPLLMSTL